MKMKDDFEIERDNKDNQLTVLMAINRSPDYTFRWMTYNNQNSFPFKIVIADGGQDEIVSEVLSNHANFPNLDYTYLHYNESGTDSELYSRIVHALEHVKTPYILKAANDDLLMVDGIRKALSFLNRHLDYVSSRGEIYDFGVSGAQNPRYNAVYGHITYFRQFNPQASIREETAIARIQNQGANYCSNWYDVYRTKDLRRNHKILQELNPADMRFAGEVTDFLAAIEGKVNRVGGLFMLHQANPIQGEGAATLKQFPTWKQWMQTTSWQKEYDNLVQLMADSISTIDQITFEEAKKQFVDFYHNGFLAPRLAKDEEQKRLQESKPTGFLKKMLNFTAQKLEKLDSDHPIRDASRRIYYLTKGLKCKQIPDDSEIKNSKYYESLMPIIKFLVEPPKSLDNLSGIAGRTSHRRR